MGGNPGCECEIGHAAELTERLGRVFSFALWIPSSAKPPFSPFRKPRPVIFHNSTLPRSTNPSWIDGAIQLKIFFVALVEKTPRLDEHCPASVCMISTSG